MFTLRFILYGSLALILVIRIVSLVYAPPALKRLGRRLWLVAYVYIGVIVLSAVLRGTGVVEWGT